MNQDGWLVADMDCSKFETERIVLAFTRLPDCTLLFVGERREDLRDTFLLESRSWPTLIPLAMRVGHSTMGSGLLIWTISVKSLLRAGRLLSGHLSAKDCLESFPSVRLRSLTSTLVNTRRLVT